jgi:uncharacterized 2Fe-2S/4Fe-4S cluster protein (DUF4445 family)
MGRLFVRKADGDTVELEFKKGETILSCLQRNSVYLNAVCNGKGKCLKCKVKLQDAKSSAREYEGKMVLACQTKLVEDTWIEIPFSSSLPTVKMKLGYEPDIPINSSIKKISLRISLDNFKERRRNEIKILEELNKRGLNVIEFNPSIKDTLLPLLNVCKGDVTVTVRGNQIIHLEKGENSEAYGAAVDIGTTQISVFLVNLQTGFIIDFISEVNKQTMFGGDVITRLSYILSNQDNLSRLQTTILNQIQNIIEKLIKNNRVNPNHLYEIVIVGNTLMTHIFYGLDPSGLAKYPYKPAETGAKEINARHYISNINYLAKIYTPPPISGYIGPDITADLLSSEMYKTNKNILLMDIGTNTEIILKYNRKFYGCSTPSGPALEGGHIKYGMRAEKGAIEAIYIDPDTLKIDYKIIGGGEPEGLCGSGIIDAIVELFKVGAVKNDGSINGDHKLAAKLNSEKVIIIATKLNGEKITLSQSDIREIQKAKAAIQAGYSTLLKYVNTDLNQLDEVIIAGSFGFHINPDSGRAIGVIPPVDDLKLKFMGNLAGSGARILLKNADTRKICERIVESVEYVELGTIKYFQDIWLRSLYLSKNQGG